jgi:ribonuclease HI
MIQVYTDGACSMRNGGWAWYTPDCGSGFEVSGSGAVADTTNNRMELRAVLEALWAWPGCEVEIISDSAYVINCMKQRWYDNWRVNGWRNSQKKPVENQDLWRQLLSVYEARRHPVVWTHVRGHQGNAGNEAADRLAVAARLTLVEA